VSDDFYLVDRARSLHPGLVINRSPVPTLATPDETDLARCVFPDGITRWGEDKAVLTQPSLAVTIEALAAWGYATHTPAGFVVSADGAQVLRDGKNRLLEMIVELVRRLEFADKPSRYTSVYACLSAEAAVGFRNNYAQRSDPVWRVRAHGSVHEADARYVDLAAMPIAILDRALKYWHSEAAPNPELWHRECLLAPPVEVIEQV
jgi:hypothetical protein